MTEAPKPVAGSPSSAQPMQHLSARAKAMLAPRKHGFCTPIEPPGAGIKRNAMTKAKI